MTREDRATYWFEVAKDDLSLAEIIFNAGRWLYVAFMCHQAIEKTLKGYWCAVCDEEPPYVHSHRRLAEGCELWARMTREQRHFLDLMVPMNIEARYPDYKREVANRMTKDAARHIIEQTKQLLQWINQEYLAVMRPLDSSETTSG